MQCTKKITILSKIVTCVEVFVQIFAVSFFLHIVRPCGHIEFMLDN